MSFIIKHVYSVHRRPKQREKTWVTGRQEHAISTLPLQVICRNPALTSIRSWITVIEFSMKMRSLYCRRSVLWVNWPQNRRTRNTLAAPYIKKHQSLQLNFRIIIKKLSMHKLQLSELQASMTCRSTMVLDHQDQYRAPSLGPKSHANTGGSLTIRDYTWIINHLERWQEIVPLASIQAMPVSMPVITEELGKLWRSCQETH